MGLFWSSRTSVFSGWKIKAYTTRVLQKNRSQKIPAANHKNWSKSQPWDRIFQFSNGYKICESSRLALNKVSMERAWNSEQNKKKIKFSTTWWPKIITPKVFLKKTIKFLQGTLILETLVLNIKRNRALFERNKVPKESPFISAYCLKNWMLKTIWFPKYHQN